MRSKCGFTDWHATSEAWHADEVTILDSRDTPFRVVGAACHFARRKIGGKGLGCRGLACEFERDSCGWFNVKLEQIFSA